MENYLKTFIEKSSLSLMSTRKIMLQMCDQITALEKKVKILETKLSDSKKPMIDLSNSHEISSFTDDWDK